MIKSSTVYDMVHERIWGVKSTNKKIYIWTRTYHISRSYLSTIYVCTIIANVAKQKDKIGNTRDNSYRKMEHFMHMGIYLILISYGYIHPIISWFYQYVNWIVEECVLYVN